MTGTEFCPVQVCNAVWTSWAHDTSITEAKEGQIKFEHPTPTPTRVYMGTSPIPIDTGTSPTCVDMGTSTTCVDMGTSPSTEEFM